MQSRKSGRFSPCLTAAEFCCDNALPEEKLRFRVDSKLELLYTMYTAGHFHCEIELECLSADTQHQQSVATHGFLGASASQKVLKGKAEKGGCYERGENRDHRR
jgi:hypothetical protein